MGDQDVVDALELLDRVLFRVGRHGKPRIDQDHAARRRVDAPGRLAVPVQLGLGLGEADDQKRSEDERDELLHGSPPPLEREA